MFQKFTVLLFSCNLIIFLSFRTYLPQFCNTKIVLTNYDFEHFIDCNNANILRGNNFGNTESFNCQKNFSFEKLLFHQKSSLYRLQKLPNNNKKSGQADRQIDSRRLIKKKIFRKLEIYNLYSNLGGTVALCATLGRLKGIFS